MARWADLETTATYSGLTVRQLRRARERGTVTSSNPTGGKVLFDLDAIDAWIADHADERPAARNADELIEANRKAARNRRRRLSVAS